MEHTLFRSGGIPLKMKKTLKISGAVLLLFGIFFLWVAMQRGNVFDLFYIRLDANTQLYLLGFGGILCIAGIASWSSLRVSPDRQAQLCLYDSYVEGVQPHPYQSFSIPYGDIVSVEQLSTAGMDKIVLRTQITSYTVPTNDLAFVHRLLCEKALEARKETKQ